MIEQQGSRLGDLGARRHPDRRLRHALLQLQYPRAGCCGRTRLVPAMGVCHPFGVAAGQRDPCPGCRPLGRSLRRRTRLMAPGSVAAAAALLLCALAPGRVASPRRAGDGACLLLRALQHRIRRHRAARRPRRAAQHHPSHLDRRLCVHRVLADDDDAARASRLAGGARRLRCAQSRRLPADPRLARTAVQAHRRAAGRQTWPLDASGSDTRRAARKVALFLLMLAGFAVEGFVLSAVLVHMVPLLAAVGLGSAAVLVASLFGPSQVASRLINMLFGGGCGRPGWPSARRARSPPASRLLLHRAVGPWRGRLRRPVRPRLRPDEHRRRHASARTVRPRRLRRAGRMDHRCASIQLRLCAIRPYRHDGRPWRVSGAVDRCAIGLFGIAAFAGLALTQHRLRKAASINGAAPALGAEVV